MQLESYQQISNIDHLTATDFLVFSYHFKEIIAQEIPTAHDIAFLTQREFNELHLPLTPQEREQLFDNVLKSSKPGVLNDDSLLFSLPTRGDTPIAAYVSGIDPLVINRASPDWFEDCSRAIQNRFLEIKNERIDRFTNLYNSQPLFDLLDSLHSRIAYQLVLIEVKQTVKYPRDVNKRLRSAARSLSEFNKRGFPFFYLGHSIFCAFITEQDLTFSKSFSLSLISFMKGRGFKRIRCGSSNFKSVDRFKSVGDSRSPVLDHAWTALHAACKRGPFAFCDFDALAHPEQFPLRRFPAKTTAKLRRRWKKWNTFALVYFVPDFKKPAQMADVLLNYFSTHPSVVSEEGFFVIQRNSSAIEAKNWAESLIKQLIEDRGKGFSLSAGISEYPFRNYSRTEIARNCLKAILHGEFFGYGSVVVFDAISLNISGDIYYGEGDLSSSVREYKRGLELDPVNINLLNSLGVAYALMDRGVEAQKIFARVLELSPANFMALFNFALGEQAARRYENAVHFFGQAIDSYDESEMGDTDARTELWYQFGVSCYYASQYQDAISWLMKWYNSQLDHKSRGKCSRYIGISSYHLSQPAEAMTWLQRALAFNEEDAESLSILGTLYLQEKEGDDIALRFMEKSLELEGDNIEYLLRYAGGLNKCGRHLEAIEQLKRCSKRSKFRAAAWLELSIAYKYLKKYNKMRYYLKKLLDSKLSSDSIKTRAKKLYNEISAG